MIILAVKVQADTVEAREAAEKVRSTLKRDVGNRAVVVLVPSGVELHICETCDYDDCDDDDNDDGEEWKRPRRCED